MHLMPSYHTWLKSHTRTNHSSSWPAFARMLLLAHPDHRRTEGQHQLLHHSVNSKQRAPARARCSLCTRWPAPRSQDPAAAAPAPPQLPAPPALWRAASQLHPQLLLLHALPAAASQG